MIKASVRSTLRILLSAAGLLIAVFMILLPLTAIQAMSGGEQLVGLLFFFLISFAIGFGLGGACVASLSRRDKAWLAARAFATGGAAGGAFLALAMWSISYFEQQLRVLTSGGPLGLFLLASMAVAFTIPVFVGRILLKREDRRQLKKVV